MVHDLSVDGGGMGPEPQAESPPSPVAFTAIGTGPEGQRIFYILPIEPFRVVIISN